MDNVIRLRAGKLLPMLEDDKTGVLLAVQGVREVSDERELRRMIDALEERAKTDATARAMRVLLMVIRGSLHYDD
jgi:RNA polymerase-interacting CarD/CdnL/TRCF family regulator